MDWLPDRTRLVTDLAPAKWIVERLRFAGLQKLSTFMPEGFSTYVRIFHPPGVRPASEDYSFETRVTWADLAKARGVDLTAEVTFQSISEQHSSGTQVPDLEPLSGSLPPQTCRQLSAVLRGYVEQDETCWFCLWDGNGFFWTRTYDASHASQLSMAHDDRIVIYDHGSGEDVYGLQSIPRVDAKVRQYFLCEGPLEASCAIYSRIGATPNVWWPSARNWIVATEVDSYSTYVGGSREIADAILNSDEIEAIEVRLADTIDAG